MASEKVAVPAETGGQGPAVAPTPGQLEAAAGDTAFNVKHNVHNDLVVMTANARRATEKEHKMTLIEGLRLYPKAAAWSMLISCCIIMEGECSILSGCSAASSSTDHPGFQVCLTPNLIAQAEFARLVGCSRLCCTCLRLQRVWSSQQGWQVRGLSAVDCRSEQRSGCRTNHGACPGWYPGRALRLPLHCHGSSHLDHGLPHPLRHCQEPPSALARRDPLWPPVGMLPDHLYLVSMTR